MIDESVRKTRREISESRAEAILMEDSEERTETLSRLDSLSKSTRLVPVHRSVPRRAAHHFRGRPTHGVVLLPSGPPERSGHDGRFNSRHGPPYRADGRWVLRRRRDRCRSDDPGIAGAACACHIHAAAPPRGPHISEAVEPEFLRLPR